MYCWYEYLRILIERLFRAPSVYEIESLVWRPRRSIYRIAVHDILHGIKISIFIFDLTFRSFSILMALG